MENFLPTSKDDEPGTVGFPINPNEWCASIPGTGNELQAWTSAGDVGKAIFALLGFESWVFIPVEFCLLEADEIQEPVTYIVGEWGTFNQAISKLEGFYGTRTIHLPPTKHPLIPRPHQDIPCPKLTNLCNPSAPSSKKTKTLIKTKIKMEI